ncbi:polyprenyl synthetase family protein [Cytobacillus praedii]|uniref:Farnesyl diphosphate synthase n=1 Tax=Cytobacillus praedii TaxID=1742358 RepID=A0A4R1AXL8_9BACI|nr:farnesyl diphosphate synthase [Cytobacillus praedii]TCJ03302.1 polyprenyl synthetase family protein [Cytobacillus praedii]
MSQETFSAFASKHKQLLEKELRDRVNQLTAPSVIKESMLYSLEAGGKRIRPLLLFATLSAFGENTRKGLQTAAAIEMIHTYSLIHDDLPSMDNDDLRRGKPTNHKVFGDAFAILAGDALLTYSFQLLAETPDDLADASTKLALIKELSKASGAEGMVGGQVADISGEEKDLSLSDLEYIHIHKTGKLLECSVVSGAILAGATEEQIKILAKFAYHLGLAFQIRDDILDLEGIEEKIGKRVGSDEINHKVTYPSLLTLEGAKEALHQHIELAKHQLNAAGLNVELLEAITNLIETRDH